MTKELKRGKYQHYKGGFYEVYGVSRHSETDELLAVYRPLYGSRELWVRPLNMFLESVEFDGEKIDRFKYVNSHLEGAL